MDERAYLYLPYSENLMSFHRLEAPFNKSVKDLLSDYLMAIAKATLWPAN